MSDPTYPVMIQTRSGPVRVGTLTKATDGIFLSMGEMFLGEPVERPAPAARPSGPLPTTFPNYGRGKNGPIANASREDLDYYAAGARRSIADPAKERWHAGEKALLAAIEAEIERQGARSAPASHSSGPSNDDIPF